MTILLWEMARKHNPQDRHCQDEKDLNNAIFATN